MEKEKILEQMDRFKLVAVVRTRTAEQALQVARALSKVGIGLIEITLTIPGALELIQRLHADLETSALIGAGSVLEGGQAKEALQAGARFIVSPVRQLDLIPICHEAGVVAVVGGLTPTEIVESWRAGADLVKVFPVDAVGGLQYIKGLLAPLPYLPLMVSGGVTLENFKEYLRFGARSLALGSNLMPTALIEAGDYQALTDHARRFVAALEPVS